MKTSTSMSHFFTSLLLIGSVWFLGACNSSNDPKVAERMAKNVKTEKDAKEFLTGIWTYTETEKVFFTQPNLLFPTQALGNFWVKVVLKKDGGFELFQTTPISDNWGNPISIGRWETDTGKYPDTGERWFSAKITMNNKNEKDTIFFFSDGLLIQNDGRLRLFQGEWGGNEVFIYLNKGDRFPFSK